MHRLFLFNPDCEMAVADGGKFYTPPANVRKMAEDLAFLPAWLGNEGDQVLVHTLPDENFVQSVCIPLQLKCKPICIHNLSRNADLWGEPWGRSPRMGHWLAGWGLGEVWKPEQKEWYSRKMAREGLKRLMQVLPELERDILPQICYSIEEIGEQIRGGSYLIKAPWSSSGKGLLALAFRMAEKEKEWLKGMLRRQGYLMLEKRLDKVKDFAMEFYKGKEGTEFLGWSTFITGEHGEYRGNFVGTPENIEKDLLNFMTPSYLKGLVQEIPQMLNGILPFYHGYLGVDMMVYRNAAGACCIHPCVEINLRYNMGIVALFLSRRYIENTARGLFEIRYYPGKQEALQETLRLQRNYPVEYENNRIKSGYLNLTPVCETTHFVASVRCY